MCSPVSQKHLHARNERKYGLTSQWDAVVSCLQRELLKRSFDQLRRTQERLGRRERKLAKEQQKCRQYQQALSVWQASLVPMTDPVAQELYQAQMQVAMTAQASAVQQAAAAAGAAAPPTAQ